MTAGKLKEFLNKYDSNIELCIGVIDGSSGEWYDFNIEFLCDLADMGDNTIGIQLEENDKYNTAKSAGTIMDLREDILATIYKYE